MKRLIAILALVVASLGFAVPAQAATQTIAVSQYSRGHVHINNVGNVYANGYKTVSKSATMYVVGVSYRVKYGTGSYSGCRTNVNSSFNAYDGTSKITFQIFSEPKCQVVL